MARIGIRRGGVGGVKVGGGQEGYVAYGFLGFKIFYSLEVDDVFVEFHQRTFEKVRLITLPRAWMPREPKLFPFLVNILALGHRDYTIVTLEKSHPYR